MVPDGRWTGWDRRPQRRINSTPERKQISNHELAYTISFTLLAAAISQGSYTAGGRQVLVHRTHAGFRHTAVAGMIGGRGWPCHRA